MTDVWRSVPKKFCNLCKCWFYDNKVSIEHHERGARHQENVRNKIREIGKKGKERHKEDVETMKALAQMEKEAIRSYKDDLKNQPEVANAYNIHLNLDCLPLKNAKGAAGNSAKQPVLDLRPGISTVWREVLDENAGLPYYWNSDTNQTSWEKPSDGYLSIDEQNVAREMEYGSAKTSEPTYSNPATDVEKGDDGEKSSDDCDRPTVSERSDADSAQIDALPSKSVGKSDEKPPNTVISPKPMFKQNDDEVGVKRRHVFGEWKAVESSPVIHKVPDDQGELHYDEEDETERKKIKFEEKKMPSLGKSSKTSAGPPVSFKKASKSGRSLRGRTDD